MEEQRARKPRKPRRDVPLPSVENAVPNAATGEVAWWTSMLASPAPAQRQWRMLEGGRKLCSPEGVLIPLTPSERILMARMMMVAGRPVHRRHIVPPSSDNKRNSARSADVQISRLREKAKRCGQELPLLAVRRWGYLFAVSPNAVAIDGANRIHARDIPLDPPDEKGEE